MAPLPRSVPGFIVSCLARLSYLAYIPGQVRSVSQSIPAPPLPLYVTGGGGGRQSMEQGWKKQKGKKKKSLVRSLAFRHKPPPAMARSESWLESVPPRVREASGRGDDFGSKPHTFFKRHTNPDVEGSPPPRRASNAFWGRRGQPFPSVTTSSFTHLPPSHFCSQRPASK